MDVDFIKSVSRGLEEAQKGFVYYTSASYLAEELDDLLNPRPVVKEEDAATFHYYKEAPIQSRTLGSGTTSPGKATAAMVCRDVLRLLERDRSH